MSKISCKCTFKRNSDNVADEQMQERIRRSEKEMGRKVRHANSCLKLLGIDFDKVTEERLWMGRSVIRCIREDISQQEVGVHDRLMRRSKYWVEQLLWAGEQAEKLYTLFR
jgi:hypothetical protein